VLIAYCTGLILVCTVLLVVSTAVTIKNYWLLRDLVKPPAPGRHDEPLTAPLPEQRTEGREARFDRYDSGAPPANAANAGEWTGPVTPYTPATREANANRH
jgi:hypothetical protein